MFSSSSSSGGGGNGSGCGCDTNGNNGGSGNIWSSGLKKQQKRPKVPKRGPGVAELEKILREQEKAERGNNNAEGFPVSPSCFNNLPHHSPPPLKPHRSPPPPPLPPLSSPSMPLTSPQPPRTYIQMTPRFDHLSTPTPPPPSPSMAALYGYNTALGRNGLAFPEQALFPMNPSSFDELTQSDHSENSSSKNLSSESNNPLWSYHALPQKRHNNNQYSPTMMKQFLGPGAPSLSSALPTGLQNNVAEPPSNQIAYFNGISRNPEDHKMVGTKRAYPSLFDNSLAPPTHFQVSPMFSNFSRSHKSSTNDSHISSSNFTFFNSECYRDAKRGSPLGYNCRKFNSDNNGGPSHPKFPSFNGPAATVPSQSIHMFQRELCKSNVLPCQVSEVSCTDRMEDTYELSESSSGSDHRPFYSFLEVKEVRMKEATLGSNHEGCDAGNDVIDLSLKL